jgi:hypothetical protein
MKTSFVEKLLLVTGFTTKLSLHFYDFSEIFGTIYKIKKLNPRSIESICTEAPRIFHQGPSKTLIFTELPPAAQGRSPAVNRRLDPAEKAARAEYVLTLHGLVASVAAGRAPATVTGEVEAAHPSLLRFRRG